MTASAMTCPLSMYCWTAATDPMHSCTAFPSMSAVMGATPLYEAWTSLMPAARSTHAIAKWPSDPIPQEPYAMDSGPDFAACTKSPTVRNPDSRLARSTGSPSVTMATCARSWRAS